MCLPLCRGFGFVTFKSPESVQEVLKAHDSTPISIDEKTVSLLVSVCLRVCVCTIPLHPYQDGCVLLAVSRGFLCAPGVVHGPWY